MTDRLREVEHNTACDLHDVYLWDFFEQQVKKSRPRFYRLRKFWDGLKPDPEFQRAKYTHTDR